MQERIAEYENMLAAKEIKDKSSYTLAARESATYFDERGNYAPTTSDWEEFAVYIAAKIEREKGKKPSDDTVRVNYVTRGKAFYRWCASQDGRQQTASLFAEDKTEAINTREPEAEKPLLTEASRPPVPDEEAVNTLEPIEGKRQSDTSGSETEKAVRTSLLIDAKTYRLLAMLAALEDKTMTEILTAGARLYIAEHKQEAELLQGVIDARSK